MSTDKTRKEITKSLIESVQYVTESDDAPAKVRQLAQKYKATAKKGPRGDDLYELNGVTIWQVRNGWKVATIVNGNYSNRVQFGAVEDAFKYAQKKKVKEDVDEGYRVVAVTKQGETFKSKLHKTAKEADKQHWKMQTNNIYRSVKVVKEDVTEASVKRKKNKGGKIDFTDDFTELNETLMDFDGEIESFLEDLRAAGLRANGGKLGKLILQIGNEFDKLETLTKSKGFGRK
jgi:hypothetical protein